MFKRKTAVHALLVEFIPLVAIVVVATVLQQLTHHLFNGND